MSIDFFFFFKSCQILLLILRDREKTSTVLISSTYMSWQEERRISLQHNAIQGDVAESISNFCSLHIGDQGCEAHIQVGKLSQERLDHLIAVCETVPGNHRFN